MKCSAYSDHQKAINWAISGTAWTKAKVVTNFLFLFIIYFAGFLADCTAKTSRAGHSKHFQTIKLCNGKMRVTICLLIYSNCSDYKRHIKLNIRPLVLFCFLHLHFLLCMFCLLIAFAWIYSFIWASKSFVFSIPLGGKLFFWIHQHVTGFETHISVVLRIT